jgi:lysophospholipase L1-like esterase
MFKHRASALMLIILTAIIAWLVSTHPKTDPTGLLSKLSQIAQVRNKLLVSCEQIAALRPIVVLAIGQSNAGNHGSQDAMIKTPVISIAEGKCVSTVDPLPGSTGAQGAIWARLPHHFSNLEPNRLLVVSTMGIDATSVDDWTRETSPLPTRLVSQIKSMQALGLAPQFILWQQGEADALAGTTEKTYAAKLTRLAEIIDQAQPNAPIVMARSTVCRSAPGTAVRAAIEFKAASNARFQLGPDTDTWIGADFRYDGCHFSANGLDLAAQLWAATIAQLVKSSSGTRYPLPTATHGV